MLNIFAAGMCPCTDGRNSALATDRTTWRVFRTGDVAHCGNWSRPALKRTQLARKVLSSWDCEA